MPETLQNQVLPAWKFALELGRLNEDVIAHEFIYQGVPVIPTEGKNDVDFYLPDGRRVEVKLDLRSQATSYAVLEEPTFNRGADIHIHTLTYAIVLTRQQVEALYRRGKAVRVGDSQLNGRLVSKADMRSNGVFLDQFIRSLK